MSEPENPASGPAPVMSLRAYARRRGVSPMAVTFAIRSGRLSRSVVRTAQGPKIADADVADREWADNTDAGKSPAFLRSGEQGEPPAGAEDMLSFAHAAAREKLAKARLAELEYHERMSRLVDARAVQSRIVAMITRCRTRLLGAPSKLKAARPNIGHAELVALDQIIRETLAELADGADASATEPTKG